MKKWIKDNRVDLSLYFGFLLGLVILIMLAVIPGYKDAVLNNKAYNTTAIRFTESIKIQWYAIFIMYGLIMGSVFAFVEVKRFGWKTDYLLDGVLIIAPLSIIGARLYYVLFDGGGTYNSFMEVINMTDGGLAIHGAIIVATISVLIYSKVRKLNVFLVFDILVIGLLVGQISGRWGNFMNAEAHGGETSSNFLFSVLPPFVQHQMRFGDSHLSNDLMYLPTFLFESLWNLVGLTTLIVLRRKKLFKTGDMLGLYLIWYGFGRGLLIEPFRTDALDGFFGGLRVNILMSLTLLLGGGIVYLVLKRVFDLEDSYYVDHLIEEVYLPFEKHDNINKDNKEYEVESTSIKAILFDLDGTLINTPEMIIDSYRNTIKKHLGEDYELTENQLTDVLGQTLDSAFNGFAKTDEELTKMIESYRFFTQNNTFELKGYENLENVIKYLRDKNYKIGIVTSKTGHVAEKNLKDLKIEKLFDVVVSYEYTELHKPNAEPILKACELLNVKNTEAIYIGDHENDIKASNNAGTQSALMGYSYRKEQALKQNPTYIFETLEDIKKVF